MKETLYEAIDWFCDTFQVHPNDLFGLAAALATCLGVGLLCGVAYHLVIRAAAAAEGGRQAPADDAADPVPLAAVPPVLVVVEPKPLAFPEGERLAEVVAKRQGDHPG